MAIALLDITAQADGYHVRVHLDTTKVDDQSEPLAAWVDEYVWGLQPPSGQTAASYQLAIKRDAMAMAQNKAASIAS